MDRWMMVVGVVVLRIPLVPQKNARVFIRPVLVILISSVQESSLAMESHGEEGSLM